MPRFLLKTQQDVAWPQNDDVTDTFTFGGFTHRGVTPIVNVRIRYLPAVPAGGALPTEPPSEGALYIIY